MALPTRCAFALLGLLALTTPARSATDGPHARAADAHTVPAYRALADGTLLNGLQTELQAALEGHITAAS